MIKENTPLSMAEALNYIKESETENTEIIGFIKKFNELKSEHAKEMAEKIEALKLLKLKREYVAKIIDLLPDNIAELNKIFEDISLDEDESNKIIEIVKQYK